MNAALEQIALSKGITLPEAIQKHTEATARALQFSDAHPSMPLPVYMREELRASQVLLTAAYAQFQLHEPVQAK